MRRLWIGLGILVVLLAAGLLGLNFWVQAYLRSAAFRQLVMAKTGESLRADVDSQPFEWSGPSVFSAALTGHGESGAPLESLDAEQVRANIDWQAIFHGAWRVSRIDIVRLDAKVRTAGQQAATAAEPGPTPEPPPPKRGLLPNRFELDRVSVQDANVAFGEMGNLRNTALVMQPEGNGWVFDGTGGKLEFPARPTLDVSAFRVRLQQGVVYLTNAALRLGATGALTTSGEVGGPRGPYDLQVQWQNVDAADVLDATWKERLSGTISGEAEILGRTGLPPLTKGKFSLVNGQLAGLPVQKEIAKFTRSPQFDHMPLSELSGDYAMDGVTTTVSNFVAESPGLLRIEGACRIGANGTIDGRFRVGVTSQSLQWLPGSQEKVFTVADRGYLWTDVTIGGTLEQPTEDLSARLARALGEQVIDTGVQILQGAPSDATDAAKKAIDLLSPLIP